MQIARSATSEQHSAALQRKLAAHGAFCGPIKARDPLPRRCSSP